MTGTLSVSNMWSLSTRPGVFGDYQVTCSLSARNHELSRTGSLYTVEQWACLSFYVSRVLADCGVTQQ